MPQEMRRAIGLRLREARLAADMTQQDVALDFLRSRQAVSSWESGKTLPSLLEFRELITLYGASPSAVLFGSEVEDDMAAVVKRAQEARPPVSATVG